MADVRAAGTGDLATRLVGLALLPSATISFDRADVFTGRAGALLRGTFGSTGAVWQPYLKGNVWWGSKGSDTVTFDSFGIPTGRNGGTTLEGGGGITGKLTRYVSVYGDASYLTGVSGGIRGMASRATSACALRGEARGWIHMPCISRCQTGPAGWAMTSWPRAN